MNSIQGGTPAVLEVTYDSPTLQVAMKVYDVTGPSPSLLATIPMLHLINNTYLASFTPESGKTYAVSKAVYTDAPNYVTRDTDRAAGSETLQAVDLSPASQIDDLKAEFLRILGLKNERTDAQVGALNLQGQVGIPMAEAQVVEIIDLNN